MGLGTKYLLGCLAFVAFGYYVANNAPPKNTMTAQPTPTAPAQETTNDPVARCSQFLNMLDVSGVDTHEATGAPNSMFGRASWCLAHKDQFQSVVSPSKSLKP
jgi:hypothetical protein